MFIISDPKDKVYKDILDLAFSVCDEFILVVRNEISISNNAITVLESLSSFLTEKREQFEWPGTKLWSGPNSSGHIQTPATVYYFITHDEAKIVLLEASISLHSWMQPNLPEDLSFIKNQKPWLINSSHERNSHFDPNDKDEIGKIMNIENLEVRPLTSLK